MEQRKKHTCVSCKHQYYSRYSGNKPQCQPCRSWRDTTTTTTTTTIKNTKIKKNNNFRRQRLLFDL